jgi:YbbR domain-containing protein
MAYHPFRHLGLKVLAITLATVLWFTVAGEHVVERSLRVPLAVRNLSQSLEIVGDLPDTVDVRVRGSSAQLSRLDPGDVVAMLDLTTARTGARLFHLRTDEVRAPYGIDVAQVMPPSISLSLEKSTRRSVPIVPATDGDPAPGFVVGRISAEPSTVEVVGPESHVREVAAATTEPVEIDGKNERVRDVVTVGVGDSSVRLVEQPLSATVVIEILPAPIERDVAGVPVRFRNLAAGLGAPRITPAVVRVGIRGQREVLGRIRPDTIEAFVDLAGLGPGGYNLRVQVDPSEEVGVGAVSPSAVVVTIK